MNKGRLRLLIKIGLKDWREKVVRSTLSLVFSIGIMMWIARIMEMDVCTWNKYKVVFLVILFSSFIYAILRKDKIEKDKQKSLKAL